MIPISTFVLPWYVPVFFTLTVTCTCCPWFAFMGAFMLSTKSVE